MTTRNTAARVMHDVGLAAWFGGSLAGTVGFNGAAADVDDPRQRGRVANAAWGRWTPFNLLAIGVHLAGAAQIAKENKARVAAQEGVASMTVAKTGVTVAALALTAYSRVLGQKVMSAGDVPVAGGTDPLPNTPPEVASAQKQLKVLQWLIPALTGSMIGMSAYAGEQQRPSQVAKGVAGRAAQTATGVLKHPKASAAAAKGAAKGAKGAAKGAKGLAKGRLKLAA